MSIDIPFALDPRLAADCHLVGELELSRVLLMNDLRFPWLILVPRIAGLRELVELARDQQHQLLDEVNRAAHVLHAVAHPDKMNIAALGNVVSQLHVHVIARHVADAAWPKPVWGVGERLPYDAQDAQRVLQLLRVGLALSHDT
ncbi:MAG: HIT domain-containing protein [Rhodanobacteraceae bacterium]|nr:HIT domain-containing protein [Rhodanobacteraceae bacterium]